MLMLKKYFERQQKRNPRKKLTQYLGSVLLIVIIFSGCATTAKYEAILNTWVGADVNNLIGSWGAPSEEYSMPNGNKMYTWLWVGNTLVTSNYFKTLNMSLTSSVTYWCKTTFTVDNYGKIVGWRYEGNACKAK